MPEPGKSKRWRPNRTSLVAGAIVIAGLWLMSLSWWFLLLTAVGTFGPGILRELGWLQDKDEFQRRADHRAGYHAFLTGGVVAFAVVAFLRSGERMITDIQELATLFAALLWFTWLLSSLLAYWGPRKTAARILYIFGSVWLVFAVVSNLGPEWTGWTALLLHPLLAAPFFGLAWLSTRWPRTVGVFLLAAAAFFFEFFGGRGSRLGQVTTAVTYLLFLGPLVAAGIALLGASRGLRAKDEEDGPSGQEA